MAKKISDAYMTYTCSCAFIENNLVDKKVSQKFKELKEAIVEQIHFGYLMRNQQAKSYH